MKIIFFQVHFRQIRQIINLSPLIVAIIIEYIPDNWLFGNIADRRKNASKSSFPRSQLMSVEDVFRKVNTNGIYRVHE